MNGPKLHFGHLRIRMLYAQISLKTKVGQLSRIAEFLFLNPIRKKVLFTLCATLMSLNLVEKVNKLGRGYSTSVGNVFLGKMAEFGFKSDWKQTFVLL